MYLLDRNNDASLAALLTQGMFLDIAVSDSLPCSSVPTVYSRISVVLLVASVLLFGMLLTEPLICQFGASGMMAWVLWFSRHYYHLRFPA
jgi:hypothetical protein